MVYEFMAILKDGEGLYTSQRNTDVFSANRDAIYSRIKELGGYLIHADIAKFFSEKSYFEFANYISQF